MANVQGRDTDAIVTGLLDWYESRDEDGVRPEVAGVERPSAGLSNETLVLTFADDRRAVVRLVPEHPSFPDVDLGRQARVHDVVAAAGVPAPHPTTYEPDPSWVGGPFLVMPYIAGRIPGQVPVFDDWIMQASTDEQRRLGEGMVDVLVAIANLDWQAAGLGEELRGAEEPVVDEVAWWAAYVAWARGDGAQNLPLEQAVAWCREHVPQEEPPSTLVWGDARLGNLVVVDGFTVGGVLDWETAALGPPEMDLAWFLALEDVQQELVQLRVPGMPDRDELIAHWDDGVGREPQNLAWHEVFALTRAFAISDRQARVTAELQGSPDPVPELAAHPLVAAIGRAIERAGPST